MRNLECSRSARLIKFDGVLQGMDCFHIPRIVRVDQRPDAQQDVTRADLLLRESVASLPYRTFGVYSSSSITCIDVKRLPASGSVTVTGPASRSNTAAE